METVVAAKAALSGLSGDTRLIFPEAREHDRAKLAMGVELTFFPISFGWGAA